MTVDPRTFDLEQGVFVGNDMGMLAVIEALRRYGALDVEFGYDWPEGDEPPPDADVRWFATVTFSARIGRRRSTFTRQGESWTGPTHGHGHGEGPLGALAEVVRACGGNVTLVPS